METTILTDDRPIVSIQSSLIDTPDYQVGEYGITKIEAYGEPAMYSNIPWVRVVKGEDIVARINCHELAQINY
jgi:hypothetical protein